LAGFPTPKLFERGGFRFSVRLKACIDSVTVASPPVCIAEPKEAKHKACFYEIRGSNNTQLKPEGGFPTQDAARIAGREDAKQIKNSRQPGRTDVGTLLVGQNAETPKR